MAKKKSEVIEQQTVEVTTKKYILPVIDYRVVVVESVPKYIHRGYTPVGGLGNKYNCWYQAVLKQWTEEVEMTEEEYEHLDWESFNNERRGAEQ